MENTINELTNYLREVNTASIILRLTLATICAGIIGLERGRKKRPAGLRTHILVCIGATLIMITGQYMRDILHIQDDVSRMGAQVISGIGFLGAGTIIVVGRNEVKGLTTALVFGPVHVWDLPLELVFMKALLFHAFSY